MRLIDADALKKKLFVFDMEFHDGHHQKYYVYKEKDVDDAPTVDAVPVVRCKDCKHRDPEDKRCDCGHDIMWQLPRGDNWFCADAERRSDE
jgi:hypothetical protein